MKATKGGNFKAIPLPEPQTVFARCYSMIDIGTVPNFYMNKLVGDARKIYVTWEFPSLLGVFSEERGEQPFVIGMELTASTADNSNLAKLISQWRNKPFTAEEEEGFDPATMVGKTCFISFIHKRKGAFKDKGVTEITNENTNLKFNGIMPKPKDVVAPDNINPYFIWDWEKIAVDGFNKDEFEKIPRWLQKKMTESEEFKKYAPAGYTVEDNSYSSNDSPDDTKAPDPPKKTVDGEW